jgi:hypothetical protein
VDSERLSFYHFFTDVDRFQFFLTDEKDLPYYFDGPPYRHLWKPFEVYSYKPRREEPDFWHVWVPGTAWAIRPEAFEAVPELAVLLGYSGELLALPYEGRAFELFNVTECIDALDKERTVWRYYDDGDVADVREPVFRVDRLGANIFKVPEDSFQRIYFWEGDDWQSQFRGLVERAGLTGLEFKFLYSEDVPAAR